MFLKIKKIPKVNWSSHKPYNFRPKFSTFFFLCFGLMLFGLGEGLLIVSFTGASPWSVLAQGISLKVMEINPDHSLIKKLTKMSKNKDKIKDLENIALLLFEQSKILEGDKPSNPVEFSRKLIETIKK